MVQGMRTLVSVVIVAGAWLLPHRAAAQSPPTPRFVVEVEASPVWQTRNDVRIPNEPPATKFSLRSVVGSGPWAVGRVYFRWNINDRHALRLLVAPLSISGTGVLDRTIDFAGAQYAPAVPTRATYRFNSYRLTYSWRFHHDPRWTWWVGGTAKIRDARIELRQGSTTSRKDDFGFVPLLHVAGDGRLGGRWHFIVDADALAGGPGRAEDVALKVGYDVGRQWTLAAGYRTVEGGADVSSVYTFAWLHYAVVSVSRGF